MAIYDPRLDIQYSAAKRSPSVLSLEDVLARTRELEQRSRAAGVEYASKPAAAPAEASTPKQEGPGGWRKWFGFALNNPIVRPWMQGLETVDLGRRLVISGVKEGIELVGDIATDGENRASWSDLWNQAQDPSFGFGKVTGDLTGNSVLDKVIGFTGDVVFDPLTYVTLGGNQAVKAGSRAAAAADAGAIKLAADAAVREGGLTIAGRRGRLTLAAAVLEATGDQALAASAARFGRPALPAEVLEKIGVQRAGVYWMGKRLPLSTGLGEVAEEALSNSRVWLGDKAFKKMASAVTPEDAKTALAAIARGKVPPGDFAHYLNMAMARTPARQAAGAAVREVDNLTGQMFGGESLKNKLGDVRKIAHRALESGSLGQDPKLGAVRQWFDTLFTNVQNARKALDPNAPDIGFVNNFFPHYRTDAAARWMARNKTREVQELYGVLFNPLDDAGSFKSRLTLGDWWFGKILDDPSELTAEALNEAARRRGGLGFDFFETDLLVVMDGYRQMYAQEMGALARRKYLVDTGVLSSRAMKTELNADKVAEIQKQLNATISARRDFWTATQKSVDDIAKAVDKMLTPMGRLDDMATGAAEAAALTAAKQARDAAALPALRDHPSIIRVLSEQLDEAIKRAETVSQSFARMYGGSVDEVVASLEETQDMLVDQLRTLRARLSENDIKLDKIAVDLSRTRAYLAEARAAELHAINFGNEMQAQLDRIISGAVKKVDSGSTADVGLAFRRTELLTKRQLKGLVGRVEPSDSALWDASVERAETMLESWVNKSGNRKGLELEVNRVAQKLYKEAGGGYTDASVASLDWWKRATALDPIDSNAIASLTREQVNDIIQRSFTDNATLDELRRAMLWIGVQTHRDQPPWWNRVFGAGKWHVPMKRPVMEEADRLSAIWSRMRTDGSGFVRLIQTRDNFAVIERRVTEGLEAFAAHKDLLDAIDSIVDDMPDATAAQLVERILDNNESWGLERLLDAVDGAGFLSVDSPRTVTELIDFVNKQMNDLADTPMQLKIQAVGPAANLKQFADASGVFAEIDLRMAGADEIMDLERVGLDEIESIAKRALGSNVVEEQAGIWRFRREQGLSTSRPPSSGRVTSIRGERSPGKTDLGDLRLLASEGDADAKRATYLMEKIIPDADRLLDVLRKRLDDVTSSGADRLIAGPKGVYGEKRALLSEQFAQAMSIRKKAQSELNELLRRFARDERFTDGSLYDRLRRAESELKSLAPDLFNRDVLQNAGGTARSTKTTILAEAQRDVRKPIAQELQRIWFAHEVDARYRAAVKALEKNGLRPSSRLFVRVVNEVAKSYVGSVDQMGGLLRRAQQVLADIGDIAKAEKGFNAWVGREAELYESIMAKLAEADADGSLRMVFAYAGGDTETVPMLARWREVGGVSKDSGYPKRIQRLQTRLSGADSRLTPQGRAQLQAELDLLKAEATQRAKDRDAVIAELRKWHAKNFGSSGKTPLRQIDRDLRERAAQSALRNKGVLSETATARQLGTWVSNMTEQINALSFDFVQETRWIRSAADPFIVATDAGDVAMMLDEVVVSDAVALSSSSIRNEFSALDRLRSKAMDKVAERAQKADAFEMFNETGTPLSTMDRINLVIDAIADPTKPYRIEDFPWIQPGTPDFRLLDDLLTKRQAIIEAKQNPLYSLGLRTSAGTQMREVLAPYSLSKPSELGYMVSEADAVRTQLMRWEREVEAAAKEGVDIGEGPIVYELAPASSEGSSRYKMRLVRIDSSRKVDHGSSRFYVMYGSQEGRAEGPALQVPRMPASQAKMLVDTAERFNDVAMELARIEKQARDVFRARASYEKAVRFRDEAAAAVKGMRGSARAARQEALEAAERVLASRRVVASDEVDAMSRLVADARRRYDEAFASVEERFVLQQRQRKPLVTADGERIVFTPQELDALFLDLRQVRAADAAAPRGLGDEYAGLASALRESRDEANRRIVEDIQRLNELETEIRALPGYQVDRRNTLMAEARSIRGRVESASRGLPQVQRDAQDKLEKILTIAEQRPEVNAGSVRAWISETSLSKASSKGGWGGSPLRDARLRAVLKRQQDSEAYSWYVRTSELEQNLYDDIARLSARGRERWLSEVSQAARTQRQIDDLTRQIGNTNRDMGASRQRIAKAIGVVEQTPIDRSLAPMRKDFRFTNSESANYVVDWSIGLPAAVTEGVDLAKIPWIVRNEDGGFRIDVMRRLTQVMQDSKAAGKPLSIADAAEVLYLELERVRPFGYSQVADLMPAPAQLNRDAIQLSIAQGLEDRLYAAEYLKTATTKEIEDFEDELAAVQHRLMVLRTDGALFPWSPTNSFEVFTGPEGMLRAAKIVLDAEGSVKAAQTAIERQQRLFNGSALIARIASGRAGDADAAAKAVRSVVERQHSDMQRLLEIATTAAKKKAPNAEEQVATLLAALDDNESLLTKVRSTAERELERITSAPKQTKEMKTRAAQLAKVVEQEKVIETLRLQASESWNSVLLRDTEMIALHKQLEDGIASGEFLDYVFNEVQKGWVSLDKIGMPSFEARADIADMIQNIARARDPFMKTAVGQYFRLFTNYFRAWALAQPGVAVRNAMSNTFMLTAAGTSAEAFSGALPLLREVNAATKLGRLEPWLASLPAERRALVDRALAIYDAAGAGQTADAFRYAQGPRRWLTDNFYTRTWRRMNNYAESAARFTLAYDSALKGMDVQDGYARVSRFLFDYSDVSTADQTIRNIIPFWFWMSRNLPLQVMHQWANPRSYAIYNNVRRNFEESQPDTPKWMRDAGFFEIGGGLVFASPMPQDASKQVLNTLSVDPLRMLAQANPLPRAAYEVQTNRMFYRSGRGFPEKREDPFGGPIGDWIMAALQQKDSEGKVAPQANYLLKSLILPLAQGERLFGDSQSDRRVANTLSFVGVPVRPISEQQREVERSQQAYELRRMLEKERSK